MTLTRGHSCVLCQQRKVRCDQQKPCSNCVRAQAECKVVPPKPVTRRKKKLRKRDLVDRVQRYEALLRDNGIQFDSIQDNADEHVSETEPDLGGLTASEGEEIRKCVCQKRDKNSRPILNMIFNETAGFPFMVGPAAFTITHLHPPGIQIFQLWQVYINNVNSLLKLTHIPTLQSKIVSAGVNTGHIPRPLEALMFSIYLITVKSMTDEQVTTTLGQPKAVLVTRFNEACQHALSNAGLMKSNDLVVLQAFVLYLLSMGRDVDARTLSCWMGIAVRMATHLGLHRDGYRLGLSPFETEQRRRLWWQLVALDERIAEITGSTVTILSSSGADCPLPSNVNDADLHPDAKETPVPHTGATEMLFYLSRMQVMIASASTHTKIDPQPGQTRDSCNVPSEQSNAGAFSLRHPLFQDMSSFEDYVESTYLKHCNGKIPFHHLALAMTRIALCKLQLIRGLHAGQHPTSMREADHVKLFICARRMLEYDTEIHSYESMRGFHWYTALHVPMEGYMILLRKLRHGVFNDDDRAWKAICDNYQLRQFIRHVQNPIHAAFRDAVLDAWSARCELVASRVGPPETPPHLVQVLQQHLGSNTGTLGQRSVSDPLEMCQDFEFMLGDGLNLPPLDNGGIYGAEWLDYDKVL
ncbi:hypothetical protein P170DRAFT_425648 [Aspergillus steynii IBT 23096]|uniref:Zn(2)-C6 fungal-type domain-containing protein n=1 Tax=Aspergillus steynii IBT 23096 TaxID=1392250 RepID=A0A2I2G6V4_9EURO|nr:uncharacterized protein P170DRAFT_425648 [Aspergillus steynii IBT 23096]PLB48606.1 hypothetical protein P170DRAFT_425648 [Aspergillus steynii IBT 23096]